MLVGHASRLLLSFPTRIFCWPRLINGAAVAEPPRRPGRPRLVDSELKEVDEETPRRRGRPRKVVLGQRRKVLNVESQTDDERTPGAIGDESGEVDGEAGTHTRRTVVSPDSQRNDVGKGRRSSREKSTSSNNKPGFMKGLRSIFFPEVQAFNYPQGLDDLLQHPAAPSHKAPSQQPPGSKIELPPLSEWKNVFTASSHGKILSRDRLVLRDPKSARKAANKFIPAGSLNKVIIEAFPGSSTALLR
jgi:hypothetical protein